jgi:hypothetical protein
MAKKESQRRIEMLVWRKSFSLALGAVFMPFGRRTRTSTPIPRFVNDDDQNMTSGDESDNEDLTDASSESDWSDMSCEFKHTFQWVVKLMRLDSSDIETINSLFIHYSHVTRQYIARHLTSPTLWEGSPFILTRVRFFIYFSD